jgi:hypothetical protein
LGTNAKRYPKRSPSESRSKVIVHELLHIKYPNHGKMFKTLYKSYLNKVGINCSINDLTKIDSS